MQGWVVTLGPRSPAWACSGSQEKKVTWVVSRGGEEASLRERWSKMVGDPPAPDPRILNALLV